jgi:hypothetical protein
MLMDTGIGDMYLNLRRDARPAGLNQCTSGENCVVPDLTVVQINSGKSTAAPRMCYQFATNATNSPPITPEPSSVNWSMSASDSTMKFVNTGRHPLALVYLPVRLRLRPDRFPAQQWVAADVQLGGSVGAPRAGGPTCIPSYGNARPPE